MGTGDVLLSIFWFFLFFIWMMLLFQVFGDIFRSADLSGWGKTMWSIFVIVLPYLGVFVYLIARGDDMRNRAVADAQAQDAATRDYIQSAAGTTSLSDELAKLARLHDDGTINDADFSAAKAHLMGTA
ncbi:SHOCT domain-containing protein [Salsipaludibacter albus]|uniref:SHOCT domain-containing protein n=1 Tax=Salsipaludibacter albus TaxID=2849650 RepID=UPI001EE4A599|nr:SHOCT domain-containing protein [Salsipaludibacter albus]MBY5162672.1 SHOCT domain-containing protein [Salsipaludibacter albus]